MPPDGNSATITTGPRGNTAVTTSSSDGIQYNEIVFNPNLRE